LSLSNALGVFHALARVQQVLSMKFKRQLMLRSRLFC